MWVIPGKFLFSHCPKTGGMAFRRNLEEAGEKIIDIYPHGKIHEIPEEYKDLPVIAISREPSEWIASMYRYRNLQEEIGGPGAWNDKVVLDRSRGKTCAEFASNVCANHRNLMNDYEKGYMKGATYIIEFSRLAEEATALLETFGIHLNSFGKFNSSYSGALKIEDTLTHAQALEFNLANIDYCEKYGYPLPEGERYGFSKHWSGWIDTTFRRYVASMFRGAPVKYFELGICEGGGGVKFFNPTYFHPESRYFGFDIWMWNPRFRAERNISLFSGGRHHIYDSRQESLVGLYDIIYIDADHHKDACTKDSVDCWSRLNSGGVMIWDDYGCEEVVTDHPEVKESVDEFLKTVDHIPVSPPTYYQKVVQKM